MRSSLRLAAQVLTGGLMLLLVSCGDEDLISPTTGSIAITTATTGPEPDADGYTLSVNEGAQVEIGTNATHQVTDLAAGGSTVRLGGLAANCRVEGDNPRTVTVEAGANGAGGPHWARPP